ncbi:MAG: four helix bundle protein [Candidatus Berkelbacteria bacterium]|nr:four helix bundle protein [Candidatus Berkelbacteria bacterium]
MTEERFIFENLEVYKKSLDFSVEICKLTSVFNYKWQRIRDQFVGAAISIPLNIAEGNGRTGTKDKINFYKIARSSSFECIPLISICLKLELINEKEFSEFRNEISEISKMLSGLINYHRNK